MTKTSATLHVTTGDSVLYLFKKAGIAGTHVAWRDALYEGPVPEGVALAVTTPVRVQHTIARGYGNPIKVIREFERRDAQIERAAEFPEIVLWFEHDLYDQLQLVQALAVLDELALEPGRIAVVQSDQYLGSMTVDELSPLLPRRRTATAAIFKSARRAWDRFTSSSPADLYAAAQEDAIGLPYLRAALRRLCEEYPSTRDGLGRSQRHALQAVAQGPSQLDELYRRSQAREEASFLGDAAFAKIIDDLRNERAALIEGEEGALVPTALGRKVLADEADWLEEHRIDRWIGGVHLEPESLVRWDENSARFV